MYTITKKPHTPNVIWDAENDRVLCRFAGGLLITDNKAVADRLAAMGYIVTGDAEEVKEEPETEPAIEEKSEPKAAKKKQASKKRAGKTR